jgi:hypothetical protein
MIWHEAASWRFVLPLKPLPGLGWRTNTELSYLTDIGDKDQRTGVRRAGQQKTERESTTDARRAI